MSESQTVPYTALRSTLPLDPLVASVELPFTGNFYPLGFPVAIATNDSEVLEQALLSWGYRLQRQHVSPIELRVLVTEGDCPSDMTIPKFRAQRNLMIAISDANHFGICELGGTFGFITTSQALLRQDDFFRYQFLEGLVYSLLDTRYLATIHSACVSWHERGVLLIGESGGGKSSLAYGCARRGWTYTSDDASSLVLNGDGRTVLGNPNSFRFRPSVASLFSELQGHVRDRNGKPTMEIRTEALGAIRFSEEASVEFIIFLDRQKGFSAAEPELTPIARDERYRRIRQTPWSDELPTTRIRQSAIERLSNAEGFKLRYADLNAAIDKLEELVG